jgi:hypothetical protein
MSSIPDPATTKWVPLQGKTPFNYYGQYSGARTYYDGDCAIGTDGILYMCVKDGTTTAPDAWPGAAGPAGPAGVGSDLRYDGSWVAGSYTDGDIVVGADGITYICVRPTSAAPVPWASTQYPGKPAYGTTLPASPVDGQEAILVDSVTNPTYQWRFRYNAGSTSAYKWEFVGGASLFSSVPTQESTASTSFTDLATVGPQIIVPRNGEYDIEASVLVGIGTTTDWTWGNVMVYDNAAGYSPTINPLGFVHPVQNYADCYDRARGAVLAGHTLKLMYIKQSGPAGTVIFGYRRLTVTPVRVS